MSCFTAIFQAKAWIVYLHGNGCGDVFVKCAKACRVHHEQQWEDENDYEDNDTSGAESHLYTWGMAQVALFLVAPYKRARRIFGYKNEEDEDTVEVTPFTEGTKGQIALKVGFVALVPFIWTTGIIAIGLYAFGCLITSLFFWIFLIFIWPPLWLCATALASCLSAVVPTLLSFTFAAVMHLKFFVAPQCFPLVDRIEAASLLLVAVCTKVYPTDDDNEKSEPDWKYAGLLFRKIFSTKHIEQFDADNKLYTNNTLKRAQWDVVSILFSFGDNKYKLTEEHSDWARSGTLGIVFLNEMFLESWVQIVLQITQNQKADEWDVIAIMALIASLCVFVLNACQFAYKNQSNKLFGLAGAFLSRIDNETIENWAEGRYKEKIAKGAAPVKTQKNRANVLNSLPPAPAPASIELGSDTEESGSDGGWDNTDNTGNTVEIYNNDSGRSKTGKMKRQRVIFLISSTRPHVLRAHMGVHRTYTCR